LSCVGPGSRVDPLVGGIVWSVTSLMQAFDPGSAMLAEMERKRPPIVNMQPCDFGFHDGAASIPPQGNESGLTEGKL